MLPDAERAHRAGVRCRRAACSRPQVGRGLCAHHYSRWLFEQDPLELPGDTAPAPARMIWRREG